VPGEVSLAVFETVRAIRNEADYRETGERDQEEQPDRRSGPLDFIVKWKGSGNNKTPVYWSDEIRQHAKSSEGASRIGCIANLAKAFSRDRDPGRGWIADRMAINVLNGTLRLTTERRGKCRLRLDRIGRPI
jgi:putative DNA primase/helicase